MTEKGTTIIDQRIQDDSSLQRLIYKTQQPFFTYIKKIQFTRKYSRNYSYNGNQEDKIFRTIFKRHIKAFYDYLAGNILY